MWAIVYTFKMEPEELLPESDTSVEPAPKAPENPRLTEIEALMATPDFWTDKDQAQKIVREYQLLKENEANEAENGVANGYGTGPHDKGAATINLLAGAGGDDAEDFVRMLRGMYEGYASEKGWTSWELDSNENSNGGYRSVVLEINGKGAYGRLKHESGVHRLVRISPFNANNKLLTRLR
jgi:peptide chain release factor 2